MESMNKLIILLKQTLQDEGEDAVIVLVENANLQIARYDNFFKWLRTQ